LGELRGGLVALDIAQKQEEVIKAIQAAGKKGSITITLNYAPVGAENREVHISAKIAAKAPAAPDIEERSIFFAEHGQLHRHDPRQGDLYRGPKALKADGSSPAEQGYDYDEDNRFGT
jgi:hypothetical protein